MVSQIGQILNKTISDKTDMQLRADVLANRTVLPTLLLSAAVLPVLGPFGAASIIAAHFGMRMSIVAPLVVLNYFRLLSYHQILVKDGRTLDLLRTIDTVVFDKTGTLTIHQPHVGRIYTWNSASESDVLAWAAAAEHKQVHPIALAIVEAATERQIAIPEISEAAYAVGYGLTVSIDRWQIRVGSHRFMQQSDIPVAPEVQAVEEAAHEQGHSLVLVARDNQIVGAIELVPTIRPEARRVIADLRQRGIKHIAIISGDREAPTRKLAHDLGIDQYFAETLPQHKAEIIDQLQREGRSVCFVGDGINDAIALKKAHVSVSMRGASTIATDTAQIVLLDGGVEHLTQIFDFADHFDRTMKTCFALVLAPSLMGMGGVMLLGYGLPQAIWFKQLSLILGASAAMEPLARLIHQQRRPSLGAPSAVPALPAAEQAEPTAKTNEQV
jgi:Cu2+-exporting ATPase